MIKMMFLGTSGAAPSKKRGMPAVALMFNGELILFDCGEGTQEKMLNYGLNMARINTIFITHAHGDHVIGIAGIVRTLAIHSRDKPLTIYVPKGQEQIVRNLITFDSAIIKYPINVIGISAGKVFSGKNYTVNAFKLNHSIKTYGYVFKEDDRKRFIKEKCKKLGVKGTMFAELLKKGSIKIGKKTIGIKQVTYQIAGKKIVYACDTRPLRDTIIAASDADILIHESSYKNSEANLAKERRHSTSTEAAEVAKKAKAKRLILTHISTRYRDTVEMLNEARKVFKNSEIANDGMLIQV